MKHLPSPDVMLKEINQLSTDYEYLIPNLNCKIERLNQYLLNLEISKVFLIGNGDSYCASCATYKAFENYAKISCQPIYPQYFLEYFQNEKKFHFNKQTLVIGISASGETKKVIEAIKISRENKIPTISITNSPNSSLSLMSDYNLSMKLDNKESSPGIRSYQYSLISLILISVKLAEMLNKIDTKTLKKIYNELDSIKNAIESTNRIICNLSKSVLGQISNSNAFLFLGSGSNYGTAKFCAAKFIEATGIPSFAQDIDEWWHIGKFINSEKVPIFVIDPSYNNYKSIKMKGVLIRKKVFGIIDENLLDELDQNILPVSSLISEELSPLLYHLFSSYLASFLAKFLGRSTFELK